MSIRGILIKAACLWAIASELWGQSNILDLSGQTIKGFAEVEKWLDTMPCVARVSDGDPNNNVFLVLVDSISLEFGESVLRAGVRDAGVVVDGDISVFVICGGMSVSGEHRITVRSPQGGVPSEYPMRLFLLTDDLVLSGRSLLQIDFLIEDKAFEWGGCFCYNNLENAPDQQFARFAEFVDASFVDPSGRVVLGRRNVVSGNEFWTYVKNSGSEGQVLINVSSFRPMSQVATIQEFAYAFRIGRLGELVATDVFKPDIEDAITLWKSRYLKFLNVELQAALLAGDAPKLYAAYKDLRQMPFSNVAIGSGYASEFGVNARQLREQLFPNLPGIVQEVLVDDIPGGKSTLQLFGFPRKGQFRIAPHESSVAVLPSGKLGAATYSSGDESFEFVVDLALEVSPAAVLPAKKYIGRVFEYAGVQPIKITDVTCGFPGIAGVTFNDLGSGRLKVTFVLKGDKSGLALTQFASSVGVPIAISADVEAEGDISHFSSIYTVSLARRNRSDVVITSGSVHNASDRGVYVAWLAGPNGEIYLPKDRRPVFVDASKNVPVGMFENADAASTVPASALEYVVSNPLQELDVQDATIFERLRVSNGILPVFQQGGVDQYLKCLEVEISESWDGESIKHGPFLLSPKFAQGSELILPLIKRPGRELVLTGKVVFANGGFKALKPQAIDELSVLVITTMIE